MTFAWPFALLSLVLVPLLAWAYVWQLRRRRRRAVAYSSVALLRAADPGRPGWKRHVPVVLLLTSLAALGVAAARPQARVDVPVSGSAVVLALDVSGSMCATDVDPNRLTAAQAAVRQFVRAQDDHLQIGLVVFSGFAQLAVPPTTDRGTLLDAIDGLTTGRGTTIGAAILKSVDAISQINPDVAPAGAAPNTGDPATVPETTPGVAPEGSAPGAPTPEGLPRSAGPVAPEIVVLLTDGANTGGVSPIEAARVAADRGVRVYPIGFGTTNPTTMVCSAKQLGGARFGGGPGGFGGFGGGFGGQQRRNALVADEATLKEVAAVTGGAYFSASGADQLQGVLRDLPRQVKAQQRDVEVSVVLAGLAAWLVLGAGWAAARWTAFPG